jgi:hypothetical protein
MRLPSINDGYRFLSNLRTGNFDGDCPVLVSLFWIGFNNHKCQLGTVNVGLRGLELALEYDWRYLWSSAGLQEV